MWRDMYRLCTKYGVTFARPSHFPRDGLPAARVACLASAKFEPWLPDFVLAIFRANFAEDREIGHAAEIRSVLEELDQPGPELVEQAQTPENKQRLREHRQRAMKPGIFGAPSFVGDGELFWGNDCLEDTLT